MSTDLTAERLSALLGEAERAHGEYERTLGHRDDDRLTAAIGLTWEAS